ncbi:MAG: dephospho-CoA kinase [Bacteroidales bacterium]|nr:dephospho-CoA kinase [Candidatus Scybalocola fimicaballi]
MLRLGITGGIGSGKSVVSKTLKVLGIPVYDCDSRAKWLQEHDADVRREIKSLLGDGVYEGERLNRKKMASMIFSDSTLLAKVEGIVHPAVEKDFNRWCVEQKKEIVGLESAILYECGLDKKCIDKVCLVYAPTETRIERVAQRDSANIEEIRRRMANQASDDDKIKKADFIVNNFSNHSVICQVLEMMSKVRE